MSDGHSGHVTLKRKNKKIMCSSGQFTLMRTILLYFRWTLLGQFTEKKKQDKPWTLFKKKTIHWTMGLAVFF